MDSIDPTWLPRIATALPGPRSRAAAAGLVQHESVGISSVVKGAEPVFWERARGAVVRDLDGNIFLDCTSSFGVSAIGYCHPRVVAAASLQQQALEHTMAGIFPHPSYPEALKAIAMSVGRSSRPEVILVVSGSEAVEVSIKLAMRHTSRAGIIAFFGGYHGQSLGALSVTSHNGLRDPFLDHISPNVTFVPYPDPYRPSLGASATTVGDACLSYISSILRSDRTGGRPFGAVLVEPMQNCSGYIIPPEGFLAGLRALCSEFGLLLILDEIFTGFGRSGSWLAADRENVIADIVCVGKAMTGGYPLAACVADRAIMASLLTPGIIPLHGSTFAANPVACAATLATIETLNSESLVERARDLGAKLRQDIETVCYAHHMVGNVRGLGMAIAVEFVRDRATRERAPDLAWAACSAMLRRGVITLVTGLPYGNVLAVCPPFVITEGQCEYLLQALSRTLEEIEEGADS